MIRHILFSLCFISVLNVFGQDLCSGDVLIEPIFSEVQVTESIVFDQGINVFNSEIDLVMDIYEPAGDDTENRPVIVMAHGGSFIAGDRKNPVMVNTCTELAKRGYVAASIEYSLYPAIILGLPDSTDLINIIAKAMGEMKSAVRFFREDAQLNNTYRIDPSLISVGGYSAGAILACHQGMLDESDEITDFVQEAIDEQGGFENLGNRLEFSDEVLSIFNIAGSVYNLDFIDDESTPIYSGHGDSDETVPYMFGLTGDIMSSNGSFNIHQRYESLEMESILYTFVGGGHTNIFSDAQYADNVIEMYDGFYAWNKEQICNRLLSSNEELATTTVGIFPNPTEGELNFRFPDDLSTAYTIEVYNQLGQLVLNSQKFENANAQINLNGANNGLYVVKVNFDDNYQPITKRVVISNR